MRNLKTYCLFFCLWPLLGLANNSEVVYEFKGPLNSEKIVELKGVWQFYWNKTAEQVLAENPEFTTINVPGSWSSETFNNTGYATYRLKFTHDYQAGEVLGIKMYSVSSAYNLYVNGQKLGGVGHFSCHADSSKPDYFPKGFYFTVQSDTVDILVEVSNYQYRQSGIWITPIFGSASQIKSNSSFNLVGYSVLIGALLIMGLYFLSFYYTKTTDKASILFAFTCFAAAFRIGSTGEIIFRQIELLISWESLVKIEFVSFCMMILFGVLYLQSLFIKDVNSKLANGLAAINIIFALLFLLLPVKTGSYLIPPYLLIVLIQLAYLLQLIIKVIIHKRELSGLIGGAYLLIFILGLNDILLSQEYINSIFLAPLGVFVFTLIQAYALTRKFSEAFNDVEHLSKKLTEINHNQEEVIKSRTKELNEQTQELKKLNNVKDRIFSIVAHDLRAPIKSLVSVLNFADDDDITLDELRKYLRGIRKNVDSLNLTLENLLVWSTNQVNGVQSTAELIDLRLIVNNKFELYSFQSKEKELKLISEIKDRAMVYIDPNHLKLILRNLISNSIKFTPIGGTISVGAQYLGNQMLEVYVSDNGIGMPADVIKKILEQGEIYTSYGTKNEKGTGLGLILCKEYVEFNGGVFRIESEPEKGTKVLFTLRTQQI